MSEQLYVWVKDSAFASLSRRDMTERELRDTLEQKLRAKFSVDEDQIEGSIDAAVSRCHELQLIDDHRFAETKAATATRAGKSKRLIERTLLQKGVDTDIVEDVISSADDREAALNYCRKKAMGPFRTRNHPDQQRQATRELQSLLRQGFELGLARDVLNISADEIDELDGFDSM